MKIVKELTITATYRVGLGNIEVPDDVYRGLKKIYYKKGGEISDTEATVSTDRDIIAAFEWFTSNICEKDAMDWDFEIEDFR